MKKFSILITILLLTASMVSATTILDCKNAGTANCVVDQSSTVASTDSPFYMKNVTIQSGVTITVSTDNYAGYAGGTCGYAGGAGGVSFSSMVIRSKSMV